MEDKQIVELIKAITEQGAKLDIMTQNIAKMEERMTKLETLREQDIKQNEKIEQILSRLEQGNKHFDKIESRLVVLENADGKRAKDLVKQVAGIFIAAVVGAIIGNINSILAFLGGAR